MCVKEWDFGPPGTLYMNTTHQLGAHALTISLTAEYKHFKEQSLASGRVPRQNSTQGHLEVERRALWLGGGEGG